MANSIRSSKDSVGLGILWTRAFDRKAGVRSFFVVEVVFLAVCGTILGGGLWKAGMVIGGGNCGSKTGFVGTKLWRCRFPNTFRTGGWFAGKLGGGMLNTVLVIGGETVGGEVSVADAGMWRFWCPNTWVFSPGGEVVEKVGGGMLNTVLVIGSGCLNVTGLFDPIFSDKVTCTLLEAVAVFNFAFFSFSNAEVRCSRATSEMLSLFTFLSRLLMSDTFI